MSGKDRTHSSVHHRTEHALCDALAAECECISAALLCMLRVREERERERNNNGGMK